MAEQNTITDIAGMKQAGGELADLKTLVDNRYGTNAEISGNTVTGSVNGEITQWKLDSAGNPIKTVIGATEEGKTGAPPAGVIDNKTNTDNTQTGNTVLDQLNSDLAQNKEDQKKLEEIKAKGQDINKEATDIGVSNATTYADEAKKLEDKAIADAKALNKEQQDLIEKDLQDAKYKLEVARDNDLKLKELDRQRLQIQAEEQANNDRIAFIEAQQNIEIEKQKSAWAYNKLGLGFSSGIINSSQKIATDGITKLTALAVQASYNQRKLGLDQQAIINEMDKITQNYNIAINEEISKATDKKITLKKDIASKIDTYNRNILLSTKEKNDKILELTTAYKKDNLQLEKDHLNNVAKIRDRNLEITKQIQAEKDRLETKYKEGLTNKVLTGEAFRLSDSELAKLEAQAGLPPGTTKAKVKSVILTGIRSVVDNTLGKDFPVDNTDILTQRVFDLIKQGKTPEEATNIIANTFVKNTPEYKRNTEVKKKLQDLELSQAGLKNEALKADIAKTKQSMDLAQKNYNLDVMKTRSSIASANRNYQLELAKYKDSKKGTETTDLDLKLARLGVNTEKGDTEAIKVEKLKGQLALKDAKFSEDVHNRINSVLDNKDTQNTEEDRQNTENAITRELNIAYRKGLQEYRDLGVNPKQIQFLIEQSTGFKTKITNNGNIELIKK